MADEAFSRIPQQQLPGHCAPTSLSSCLALLGIEATPRQLAHAAGKPWRVFRDGLDEHDIRKAAAAYGARAEFLLELDKRKGAAFATRLRTQLQKDLPAVLLISDLGHWVAVCGVVDGRFVVMDPNDDDRAFERWTDKRLLREAWNAGDGEDEPDQYFAIVLSRTDGKAAKWHATDAFIRLCATGSEDTADRMAADLKEMVDRAGGKRANREVALVDVLGDLEHVVLASVDYWAKYTQVKRADLVQLYRDYCIVAAAADLRVLGDADRAVLAAQLATVVATYAWTGEL